MHFLYVFILKFALYMFGTDTPFIISCYLYLYIQLFVHNILKNTL
jgi:hypothetical protein